MTPTPITTASDVVTAAMGIADDAAQGRLAPATLEAQLETELRELVGVVVGEGDPLFDLQVDIARGVLAVGGVPTDELAEWLAVARHRAGETPEAPDPANDPLPVVLPVSGPHRPETGQLDALIDTLAEEADEEAVNTLVESDPVPVAPAVTPLPPSAGESGGYDPLRGFDPRGTRRR